MTIKSSSSGNRYPALAEWHSSTSLTCHTEYLGTYRMYVVACVSYGVLPVYIHRYIAYMDNSTRKERWGKDLDTTTTKTAVCPPLVPLRVILNGSCSGTGVHQIWLSSSDSGNPVLGVMCFLPHSTRPTHSSRPLPFPQTLDLPVLVSSRFVFSLSCKGKWFLASACSYVFSYGPVHIADRHVSDGACLGQLSYSPGHVSVSYFFLPTNIPLLVPIQNSTRVRIHGLILRTGYVQN